MILKDFIAKQYMNDVDKLVVWSDDLAVNFGTIMLLASFCSS